MDAQFGVVVKVLHQFAHVPVEVGGGLVVGSVIGQQGEEDKMLSRSAMGRIEDVVERIVRVWFTVT